MKTAEDHLAESCIEELAYDFTKKGFDVTVHPAEAPGVDLIAEKDGKRIAYYVRMFVGQARRPPSYEEMMEDKERYGFTDVLIRNAAPKRRVTIRVEELDTSLLAYLKTHPPVEFASLLGTWTPKRVAILDYDSIELKRDGCVIQAEGIVEADQDNPDCNKVLTWKFLLNVTVELTAQLELRKVRSVRVDTNDYDY